VLEGAELVGPHGVLPGQATAGGLDGVLAQHAVQEPRRRVRPELSRRQRVLTQPIGGDRESPGGAEAVGLAHEAAVVREPGTQREELVPRALREGPVEGVLMTCHTGVRGGTWQRVANAGETGSVRCCWKNGASENSVARNVWSGRVLGRM